MKSSIVQFTIDIETKKILVEEAKNKNLSLSSYIKMIIAERNK